MADLNITFRKGLDHDKSHDTDPTKMFKMRRYVCNYTIPLKVTVSGEIFNFPVLQILLLPRELILQNLILVYNTTSLVDP